MRKIVSQDNIKPFKNLLMEVNMIIIMNIDWANKHLIVSKENKSRGWDKLQKAVRFKNYGIIQYLKQIILQFIGLPTTMITSLLN